MKGILLAVCAGSSFLFLSGCTRLEDRVAALESVTAVHTNQLASIFGTEAVTGLRSMPDTVTSLVTLTLPAGSYVISGQVSGTIAPNTDTRRGGIGCELRVTESDGDVYQVGAGTAGVDGANYQISPIGTVTIADAGVAAILCHAPVANGVSIDYTRVVATGVPKLLSSAAVKVKKP